MKRTPYAQMLLDPRWQKKRLEIMERDAWRCRRCNETGATLHVHHLAYAKGKPPWEVDADDLMTLCEACHEIAEDRNALRAFRRIQATTFHPHVLIRMVEAMFEAAHVFNVLEVPRNDFDAARIGAEILLATRDHLVWDRATEMATAHLAFETTDENPNDQA